MLTKIGLSYLTKVGGAGAIAIFPLYCPDNTAFVYPDMYVRVKRKHQTIFQEVTPQDSFLSIKEKLSVLMDAPPENIQLWHPNKVSQPSVEVTL